MAINNVKFRGSINASERIDLSDIGGNPIAIINEKGELILETKSGRVSIDDLLRRIEALEQAYMEDKLMGKTE